MIVTVILLVFLFIVSIVVRQVDDAITRHKLFKYDRNPHRRTCKICGSLQEEHCRTYNWNETWWEEMGEGNKSQCVCKQFQIYKP